MKTDRSDIKNAGIAVLKISDMRPKELFVPGCQVTCPGASGCSFGIVMEVDSDNRLARVDWSSGNYGWWYLKDLEIVGYQVQQSFTRERARSTAHGKRELEVGECHSPLRVDL